jgi:hypothetical protein
MLNNPDFKWVEFAPLLREAGTNAFTMSPSRWIELTNDICIVALNAVFINDKLPQSERLIKLNKIAIQQMKVLENIEDKKC